MSTDRPSRLGLGPAGSDHERARLGSPKERRAYVKERRRRAAGGKRRRLVAAELAPAAAVAIDPELGFARLAPGELDGADAVVAAARDVIERTGAAAPAGATGKPMSKNLLTIADLGLDSPFMRFALSDAVLGTVSAYLELVPVLTYVDVWHSRHIPRAPFSSQLWHLDHADVTQVKLFLHCEDVGPGSGPLTVLDAAASRALAKRAGYTFAQSRLADEAVRELAGAGTPLTGPCGSAALVDTSRCFHFGSRVEPGAPPRTLVVLQYLTPYAFAFQHDHRSEAPFRELAGDGSGERARLVLGAD
jgi:hypothetical protein